MRRLLITLILILAAAASARANQAARGWCESGGQVVITSGLTSTTQVQASYPNCTVTVFVHGGGVATIYSDNNAIPTPLANPFTAQTNGQWIFYSANGRYDIQLSGAGFPTPVTYSDVMLNDSGAGGVVFGVFASVPFSATPVFNAATASIFNITLTGNVTSSTVIAPVQNGQVIEIYICQDAFGGHSFTFPANFTNTAQFTLATGGNACSPTSWWFNGTTWQPFTGGASAVGIIPPSQGGTGTATPTAHGVAVGEGASTPFTFITPTNNGQCLMSAPSNFATTDPSYQSCPTGSGGTSAGPLGTVQEAGASAGSFAVSPLTDIGGAGTVVKNAADNEWCGANPFVDARCYAREVSNASTMVTAGGVTATCTSGLSTVTLSIASDFVNGDGVTVYHCGGANSSTTPTAPTVTPSGSALGTGTRIVVPSAAPTLGSTTYQYQAVGINRNKGTSPPSPATVITTGAASLGTQTATISTITGANGIATVTTTTPHTLSVGYEINIGATVDASGTGTDNVWGGNYVVSAVPADSTHFTYLMRQDQRNGAPSSTTGGTVTWTNTNHINMTASGGYDYYAIYGRTAGSMAVVCITEPVNAALVGDQAYLACDDYGATISGNFSCPEYLPTCSSVPGAATSDSLTTTISSGAGTTSLVLAAAANTSGTNTIHYDAAPNLIAGATAAVAAGTSLYLPVTTGTNVWFTASYLAWPANTRLLHAGSILSIDTWNISNVKYWRGVDGAPCTRPSFGLVCAPVFTAGAGAYPGVFDINGVPGLDKITFLSGVTNNQSPLLLLDSYADGQANNLNFAGTSSNSEYLFTGLEFRGHHSNGNVSFANVFSNLSFVGGSSLGSAVSTPLFYCNSCSSMVFDHISLGRRGIVYRASDAGGSISFHWGYNQGSITPWIRLGHPDSGFAGILLNIDSFTLDTTSMPLVSSLTGANTSVNIVTTNGPSFAGGGGGDPPLTTGFYATQSLQSAGNRGKLYGTNTVACNSAPIWDTAFNAFFQVMFENICAYSSQLALTQGYSLFAADSNITAPSCATTNTGPPFTSSGTYFFQYAAEWFGGNLGAISPNSTNCTSNGSQQITVTMPSVPPTGSLGWAVFENSAPAGASFPSTTTASYLYTALPHGGGAPVFPGGGPAGIRSTASVPGAVWGNFYPNAPNNVQNALPSYDSSGKLIATPCVPSTAGSQCVFNGTVWGLFAGNSGSQGIFEESAAGNPSWVAAPLGNLVGTGQSNTWTTGVQDLSAVTEFRPKSGLTSAIPATCTGPTPMDVYIATDSQPGRNWYFCTATNTWTQQVNTGDLGLNTYGSSHTLLATESWANFTATATATIPHALNLNRWVTFCTSTCTTLTLAPDSGNITLNGAAPAATATVSTGLGVEVSCDGTNCFAYGLGGSGGGGGSGTVSSGTVNGPAYYTAATTVGSVTPPTTPNGVPSTLTSTPSGGLSQPPALSLPGIVGRAVSGTAATDTILSTDCNPNRIEYVGSVAVAVTLPTATTLGVPKCVFKLVNATVPAQTVTVTPTTWTINGSASFPLQFGQQLWIYVDPNSTSNWVADVTDLAGNVCGAAVPVSAKLLGTNSACNLIAAALGNTHIYVGNGSNLPVDVAVSGDVSLANTGAFTVLGANGGTFPASANVLGTNVSKQPVTATAHNIILPWDCADTSGSGTAQVCNTSPTYTPVAGDGIIYTTTTANTGTALTINVNSLGAKPVAKWQNSTTLAAGDLKANVEVLLTYDGTNWELSTIGNAPAGGGGSPCTTTANSIQYNNGGAFGCVTEFTYASSTVTASSTGKLDLSAASVTAGFKLPSAAAAAPTSAGITSYDTTNNKLVYGNATNTSTPTWITSAPVSLQIPQFSGTQGKVAGIDFPDSKSIPFAICVNGAAATGVTTTTTVGGTCRAGTNNKDAFIGPFTTSDSVTFKVHLPKDWDTATAPSLSVDLASTDATNGHTVILQVATECSKLDGSTTDDVAFNTAQSLGTVTLGAGGANQTWTATLTSLTTTGCSAPGIMWLKITRTTDTATNVELYEADVTIPRLLVNQAN